MTIEIPLTRGYVAIIDDEDADLAGFKWTAKVNDKGVYAQRGVTNNGKRTTVMMHRVILSRKLDRPLLRSEQVDHEHGYGLDNRRVELRLATHAQNNCNHNISRNNTSGLKGASWSKQHNKWRARIGIEGKAKTIGYFDTLKEAHRAYCEAAIEHYDEWANFGYNSPFKPEELKQMDAAS